MFTNIGRQVISGLLRHSSPTVVFMNGSSYNVDINSNTLTPTTARYNQTGTGCSLILSTNNAGSEASTNMTGIINLGATSVANGVDATGNYILTYIFTNTSGSTLNIKSIGLGVRQTSAIDRCCLAIWRDVPERSVENNETFTFTIKFNIV